MARRKLGQLNDWAIYLLQPRIGDSSGVLRGRYCVSLYNRRLLIKCGHRSLSELIWYELSWGCIIEPGHVIQTKITRHAICHSSGFRCSSPVFVPLCRPCFGRFASPVGTARLPHSRRQQAALRHDIPIPDPRDVSGVTLRVHALPGRRGAGLGHRVQKQGTGRYAHPRSGLRLDYFYPNRAARIACTCTTANGRACMMDEFLPFTVNCIPGQQKT